MQGVVPSELEIVWTMLDVDWSRVTTGRPIILIDTDRNNSTWVMAQDSWSVVCAFVFSCVLCLPRSLYAVRFSLGLTDVVNDSDFLRISVEKRVRFPSEDTGVKCVIWRCVKMRF